MLYRFGIRKEDIGIDQLRSEFKQKRKFSRKRIVPVNENAITPYNLNLRKKFVQIILPYLEAES